MDNLFNPKAKLVGYYPGTAKLRKLFLAEIRGTTFTGHPTRTTKGNTLRSWMYCEFIMHEAGVPKEDYRICVAGDDV